MFYASMNVPYGLSGGLGGGGQIGPTIPAPGPLTPPMMGPGGQGAAFMGAPPTGMQTLLLEITQRLQELQATDPQRFHVIAKQFRIGPYAQGSGANPAATGEFPHAGTPAPGEGNHR